MILIIICLFIWCGKAVESNCFNLNENSQLNGNKLTVTGKGKMCDCSIKGFEYNLNITTITTITFTGEIISIGNGCFANFENLETVEIGEMVQYLDTQSFYGCTSLKSIVLPSNVLVIYPFALSMCTSLSSIVISGDMIGLNRGAFWGCDKLQSVIYFGKNPPDYIKTEDCNFPPIGCGTPTDTISCAPFSCGCDKLGNISVPNNYLGTEFVGMPITKLNQGENINGIFKGSCGKDCQYEINMTSHIMKISGNGEMDDYKNYKECPWFGLTELIKEIIIENGITRIGNYSFFFMTHLTQITLPNSLVSIGSYAFKECYSLASITIPENVLKIEDYSFMMNEMLSLIILKSKIITFGSGVFWGCNELSTIYYYGTTPTYSQENVCYSEELQCGNQTSPMNCSPFSCNCTSLTSVYVNKNYLIVKK